MNQKRKTILGIVTLVLIAVLAGAAVYVSSRLSSQQALAPTAPTESRASSCEEACPDPSVKSLLRSCTPPEADGTSSDSLCDRKGRVEVCANKNYCCPAAGGEWTTDMTNCPSATTMPVTGSGVECDTCSSNSQCGTGLRCDLSDGRCKKNDGSTVCYVSSAACLQSAVAICVPDSTVVCEPDCPTECGTAASQISTCKDSCGVATTKSCPATAACGTVDVSIVKKAFSDGTSTEITSIARNQTVVYAIIIKNNGTVTATGVTVTDTLDGDNQDLLSFVDVDAGCTYSNTNKTVTCSGISLASGATKRFNIRVKLNSSATNGTIINNKAEVDYGETTKSAEKDLLVNTVVGCNQSCTSNANCSSGLTCDTTTNTCRKSLCVGSETCVCTTANTVTTEPTATTAPTSADGTSPSVTVTREATQQLEELPKAGMLGVPGVAAFGGGLLLAIVGILLAL